jgi:putative phosphoribosyl transferase
MTGVDLPLLDRVTAGRALAEALEKHYAGKDVLVLALPRGGVPVAYEVAAGLHASMDILLVRKLGAPGQRELAAGAIASGGVQVLNQGVIDSLRISREALARITQDEGRELQRRERLYRGTKERPPVAGRSVILVDDGVATGATMRAAIAALRKQHPERIVVAVPVAAADTVRILEREADEVVCLATPAPFLAIGRWYDNFQQVSDDEVRELLGTSVEAQ